MATSRALTVVRGWPGVGKTTLLRALTHDPETAAAFPDGLLWASAGESPNPMAELAAWARRLGDPHPRAAAPLQELMAKVRGLLVDRRALLLVDDVWEPEAALPFQLAGPGGAMLVTTRFPEVARQIAPAPGDIYLLGQLDPQASFELLQRVSPTAAAREPEQCRRLADDLEGLPLALIVAGRLRSHGHGRDVGGRGSEAVRPQARGPRVAGAIDRLRTIPDARSAGPARALSAGSGLRLEAHGNDKRGRLPSVAHFCHEAPCLFGTIQPGRPRGLGGGRAVRAGLGTDPKRSEMGFRALARRAGSHGPDPGLCRRAGARQGTPALDGPPVLDRNRSRDCPPPGRARSGDRDAQCPRWHRLRPRGQRRGRTAVQLRDREAAAAHLEEALALAEQLGDLRTQAIRLGNLANLYADREELGRATDLHRRALDLTRDMEDLHGTAVHLHGLGALAARQDRIEEAASYLREAADLFSRTGARHLAEKSERALGRIEEARTLFLRARDLFSELGMTDMAERTEHTLSQLTSAPGLSEDPVL